MLGLEAAAKLDGSDQFRRLYKLLLSFFFHVFRICGFPVFGPGLKRVYVPVIFLRVFGMHRDLFPFNFF